MVQSTESALVEVSNLLVSMRQLAIHAANEGANDSSMLEADQLELENSLDTIDRITVNAQFGRKRLLDGSQGANGVGIGRGLEFISATPETRSSPVEGYEVRIHQLGSQAFVEGSVPLTQEMVDAGEEITISEGGRTVSFIATPGDSVAQAIGKLKNEVQANRLDVTLDTLEDGRFAVRHNQFGSVHGFSVASKSPGVLSPEAGQMTAANPGRDIQGTIGGHVTTGEGIVLTGADGTPVEGIQIRYTGDVVTAPDASEDAPSAGRVAVFQNSSIFQVGPNAGQTESVSLVNTNTRVLGRGVPNPSGFRSLQDIVLRSAKSAEDGQRLIDQAIDEITTTRAQLGAFQKNTLESNLRQLRIGVEELTNAESVIRDSDMAAEVAEFTRNSIMVQSATAMLAQANQMPKTVLSLLG
jgi:flagellin